MNEIPDVLLPLVETHEEDGDPVAECDPECGLSMIYGEMGWYLNLIGLVDNKGGHCPACGTLLGFLSDGTPYRIRHSRVVEALEQAQAERDHLRRALEWAAVRDRVGVRTALAATKEAQP